MRRKEVRGMKVPKRMRTDGKDGGMVLPSMRGMFSEIITGRM